MIIDPQLMGQTLSSYFKSLWRPIIRGGRYLPREDHRGWSESPNSAISGCLTQLHSSEGEEEQTITLSYLPFPFLPKHFSSPAGS